MKESIYRISKEYQGHRGSSTSSTAREALELIAPPGGMMAAQNSQSQSVYHHMIEL